ncbi:MAG: CorA family divalent cation transporter [Dehalococcoidales bacterium]|jgi:Mg2+ and Co2+ transporter CorA
MDNSQRVPGKPDGGAGQDKPDRKQSVRDMVNLILPDSLMIFLALIMVPVVLLPLLVDLPGSIDVSLNFIDYIILGIFIIEYLFKTVFARNVLKHIFNPWHLLDLLIIAVPLVNLLPMVSLKFGSSSLMLRLLRIVRLLAIGGRAVDRKVQLGSPAAQAAAPENTSLEINVMDGHLENNYRNVPLSDLKKYLDSPSHTWADISYISEDDYDLFSDILGIPRILLESELIDESYPRADYFEHYAMIFARIADMQFSQEGPARLLVNRKGLLVICQKQNVITVSKSKTDLFRQIIEKAKKIHSPQEPVVVTILYTILKYLLDQDKQIIAALERELMILESSPLKNRPAGFLETTFHFRKEVDQLVPSLLHLKEIIAVITSKRVPLEGFAERHEKIFDILMDEATYLHETAANVRDNVQSLIDLYINTTSFETNKVMRVIAVITSLGIIPALMGLLGSNVIGNPWNIHLWQVFSIVGIVMLAMGWIFYRLGWLKG